MSTLLIVDSHALIHRAFHAIPPLTSQDGTPTNAVYGYFNMLEKVLNDIKPTHLVTAFDTPVPSFRHELVKEYQANRPPTDDKLKVQFNLVKDVLDCARVVRLEKDGFEADDVIGTIVKKMTKEHPDLKIIILTGDKDLFQLVTDHVFVLTPQIGFSKAVLYTPDKVTEKMGVPPEQITDYKALVGDPSDNYFSAPGIGPKTAAVILSQAPHIQDVYDKLSTLVLSDKVRETLSAYKDAVLNLKKVATIVRDVDVDVELEKLKFNGFPISMRPALEKFQLFSLINRLFKKTAEAKPMAEKPQSKPNTTEQTGLF